jgi:hypothetical protein
VLADSGYVSEENFARADAGGLRLLAPLAKDPARRRQRAPQRPRNLDRLPATARATRRLRHPRGRDDYKLRARTVEPVFGQLKACRVQLLPGARGQRAGAAPGGQLQRLREQRRPPIYSQRGRHLAQHRTPDRPDPPEYSARAPLLQVTTTVRG